MIRDLEVKDLKSIEQMNCKFPLLFGDLAQKVVEIDGEIIGAGFLKITTEASIVISSGCKLTRARAIKELIDCLTKELDKVNLDSHVFLLEDEEKTANFLSFFGFIPATGKAMYLPRKNNG